jgi:hypothetical protein
MAWIYLEKGKKFVNWGSAAQMYYRQDGKTGLLLKDDPQDCAVNGSIKIKSVKKNVPHEPNKRLKKFWRNEEKLCSFILQQLTVDFKEQEKLV